MHPGIKVQFELDMEKGDDALSCRQCLRPTIPNTKYAQRLPTKLHPPLACGMTLFGCVESPWLTRRPLSESDGGDLTSMMGAVPATSFQR